MLFEPGSRLKIVAVLDILVLWSNHQIEYIYTIYTKKHSRNCVSGTCTSVSTATYKGILFFFNRRKLIPPTSHKLGEEAVTTETKKTDHQSHNVNSIGNKEEGHKPSNISGLAVSNESKNLPTKSVSPPSLTSLHKRPPTHHLVDLQHDGAAIVESRTTKCVAYHAVRHDY